jgi:hypothetical protein
MLSIHRSWVPILGSDLALTFCHRQAEDELLGTMTDRKLAKRLGRKRHAGSLLDRVITAADS